MTSPGRSRCRRLRSQHCRTSRGWSRRPGGPAGRSTSRCGWTTRRTAPSALGRDAYRIVQEALTNIRKHARGTTGGVRVTGAADRGLHVSVRNRLPVGPNAGPALPGSGAGLLGLQERVTLAGGTLVHGPDGAGDFVVDAELPW